MEVLPEPSPLWQVFAVWFVPFLAYFLGIFIRKTAFPGDGSPPLYHQMLLGVPVSLIVVSVLIVALQKSIGTHVPTYLFTIGIIMEHGMLVHEEVTSHLKKRLQ